jgi:hypothetical protein
VQGERHAAEVAAHQATSQLRSDSGKSTATGMPK